MVESSEFEFIKSHFTFWDSLNSTEKNTFENNLAKVHYKKGTNLHDPNGECLGVVLVQTGGLRVYILSEDGREVTLYRLSPGNLCVLSASCILNSITFDVHIDAEVDTTVFLLNASAFGKLNANNIYVENFALKNATERFSDVMWSMEQILFLSFDKRLAVFLLDELSKSNSSEINYTQDQIAKYIGSAREVVSRMLKLFQEEGILEQSRGCIHVLDKEKLKKLIY